MKKRVSRYPASVRLWQYLYLVQRDGERCAICGKGPEEATLEQDHIDGDPNNNDPSNLRLLCHADNLREYWRRINQELAKNKPTMNAPTEVLSKKSQNGVSNVRGRSSQIPTYEIRLGQEPKATQFEPEGGFDKSQNGEKWSESVIISKNDGQREERSLSVEYESPEIRINRQKEPDYRSCCLQLVLRPNGLNVWEAVHEVAQIIDISPTTARRYLSKLISKSGPFELAEGKRGYQKLKLRESYWKKEDHLI